MNDSRDYSIFIFSYNFTVIDLFLFWFFSLFLLLKQLMPYLCSNSLLFEIQA